MDNNKKLDFIARYERARKIKFVLSIAAVLTVFGLLMIYFQVMNFEKIE